MAKLVILIGLPGAGKSDYREQDGKNLNAVEIGTDDIRLEYDGVDTKRDYQRRYFDGLPDKEWTNEHRVFAEAKKRVSENLASGNSVIFEAINLEEALVAPFIEIARELNADIECFHFHCPLDELLRRNRLRKENNVAFDMYIVRKFYQFVKDESNGEMNVGWADKYGLTIVKRNTTNSPKWGK
jgi:predicted kinase